MSLITCYECQETRFDDVGQENSPGICGPCAERMQAEAERHEAMHRESAEAIRRGQWNVEQPPLPWD
jgi:hypothetical protein